MEKNSSTEMKVAHVAKNSGGCIRVALVVISVLVAMLVAVSIVLSLEIIQLKSTTALEPQESRERRSSDLPTVKTLIQQLQALDRAIQALDRAVQVLNTSQQMNINNCTDSPTSLLEQYSYETHQYIDTQLSSLNANIQAANLQLWNETRRLSGQLDNNRQQLNERIHSENLKLWNETLNLDAQIVSTRQQLLESIQTGDVQLWNETKKQITSSQQLLSESIHSAELQLWNETERLNIRIDDTQQQLSSFNDSIQSGDFHLWNERLSTQIDSNQQQLSSRIEDVASEFSERQNQIQQLNETVAVLQVAISSLGHYSIFPALSCAALPSSFLSGYYWVRASNGSAVQVFCNMTGRNPLVPLSSCAALPPASPSGYYWVRASNGSAVRVYCDMTRSCGGVIGGWTRVTHLDMTNSTHQCPSGFRKQTESNKRTCVTNSTESGCTSVFLDDNSISYSSVCGLIRGYQFGHIDAFLANIDDINSYYMDGVSLTYGSSRRKHIWTFAVGRTERSDGSSSCPCQTGLAASPPSFVQNDYFCDTGFHIRPQHSFNYNNPLWDGAGCGPNTNCCSFNTPPWFYKQLPELTSEGIEMRVCRSFDTSDENIAIEKMNIYVR